MECDWFMLSMCMYLYVVIFDRQELAEMAGDHSRVQQLADELEDVEEKASELEKRRVGKLNSITYV